MVSLGRQMLGFILACIGFVGTIIVCALPMWKVTAFIGANIVTAQVIWEGLWMNCVTQSTGQMQCKIYDSLLALPQDLQAARALVVLAIVVAAVGIILGIAGGKCTNFVKDKIAKAKVAVAAGAVFICAGVLVLIPVCWSANTIIRDFYNPILTNPQRRELGAALYTMPSMGMQMAGCALSLLGWIGVLIACGAPMWRVTAFIGSTIVTSQTTWEGLWMSCVFQSTGQMQCKVYDSMLALTQDLQAARALMVVSIIVGVAGVLMAFTSGKCTSFIPDKREKARVAVAGGVFLIISGLLCIIPACWTASLIIRNFYNPTVVDAQKRELGASLYIAWGAGGLLLLGGGLLCASCPPKKDEYPSMRYLANKSSGGYGKVDSVRSYTPTKTYI
ncbi:claudin-4-like [Corythoichthys intestinalis]|uniref:claudin-4-like n=1 Tax=Corythoichthys intestinalis TaxID=161448 RepID=UPI0025A4F97E|nr:claudin-4-like [Corythoichthys intestinalis]XP_057695393.1 claudin-4-like [Corythoichthys intestinalis]XP_061797189.1 claudin-4-like [Nerophis lumbriciformis]